jgi:SNF2 family DNA or RNA helicase
MRAEDWLVLPERIDNIVRVHLPPKVLKQYKEFERTMRQEEMDLEAINNGVLTQKLLQLCSGSVYSEDKEPFEFHDLKARALDAIIEEADGKPVLVAYSYQFDLEKLRRRYKGAEVIGEEPGCVTRWNNGEIPVLLAHPASASFGLNLQHGGHITVWYGLPWSLEHYLQFNARLLRSGQKAESVIIHHIVADGTLDDRVLDVLRDKAADQSSVIQATLYRPS